MTAPANADSAALAAQLRERWVGFETKPVQGPDPVNRTMIRHWCEVFGDANPIYTDPEAAAASSHGELVAPPTMLQTWMMPGYAWAPGDAPDDENSFKLLEDLEAAGYPAIVAVNSEQEYHRYLKEGDHLSRTSAIESISDEKKTALGSGFFITEYSRFFDLDGELVAEMRFRVFKYKASGPPPAAAAPDRDAMHPRPVINHDNEFFWEGVARGEFLIQKCLGCKTLRHPPAPMCASCQSLKWETISAAGTGELYSFVTIHHPPIPPFDYPNLVGIVALDEGIRTVSRLIDMRPEDAVIGMPMELVCVEAAKDLHLPLFRPRDAGKKTGKAKASKKGKKS